MCYILYAMLVNPRTCPNRRCGNICFARRTQCNLCGAEKPTDWTPAHLKQEEGAGFR